MFKNDLKYLGFNDLWFMIIGIIALGFLIPQIFFGIKIGNSNNPFYLEWLEASMYASCYWTLNRFIMIRFRKRYPSFDMVKKRLIYGVLTCVVGVLITGIIISPFINLFFTFINYPNTNHPSILSGFSASLSSTFFILAIYESIWYYSQLKKSVQEQERVKVAHVQSQLDGLRNQVNPHFLFNSLNTLNHIVEYENKTMAKDFIGQLSKVYRYILDSREESTIILGEELDFVNAYVSIQKERFLESLQVNIDVPQQYTYKKIIPLSLQLLIENAIKHNIISTKKPLTITIDIDEQNQLIRVTNNLQKKSKVLHSTKVGLENIKERYRLLSDDKSVTIEATENFFSVSIPLL